MSRRTGYSSRQVKCRFSDETASALRCLCSTNYLSLWLICFISLLDPMRATIVSTNSGVMKPALTNTGLGLATKAIGCSTIATEDWVAQAKSHCRTIDSLLYPPEGVGGVSMKARAHAVATHPIYNFLHTYYRYSINELRQYSPGCNVFMEASESTSQANRNLLHGKFLKEKQGSLVYEAPSATEWLEIKGKYSWLQLARNKEILKATTEKAPFFGCFGLHEWAMLYAGRKKPGDVKEERERHQPFLSLRVSQEVIDHVVENGTLKCTHFDAWRFFHPDSQPYNIVNPLSREKQIEYEQPGCIHATMDLFKYAYQLYPLLPSELLLRTLFVAIDARRIDMRASPYAVHEFAGCEEPIRVETAEGRKQYIKEQESLYEKSMPIREKVLEVYEQVLQL